MKVVILCGGKGTRLREETEYRPKPMVEIGGRPIIWHIMKLYSHYGFKDFILCTGYKKEIIKEYFLNYRYMNSDITISLAADKKIVCNNNHAEDWNVTIADTGLDTPKSGRLKQIAPYLEGQRFMVTYGDGVADVDIKKLLSHHEAEGVLATFTGVHPISRFATVEYDENNTIIDWNEKKPLEGYMNAGFFVFENDALSYMKNNEELEEEPMKRLVAEKQLSMYKHEGYWQCMDTYRDYMLLSNLWNNGKALWKVWDIQ